MSSYYAELEIKTTATADEIKLAYRRLAKVYHPDRNPNDTAKNERFIRIAKAYEVLKDPKAKAAYDAKTNPVNNAKPHTATQQNPSTAYSNSDFEQFFGFTQQGEKIKKQTKNTGNPIDVSEMFERFFKK